MTGKLVGQKEARQRRHRTRYAMTVSRIAAKLAKGPPPEPKPRRPGRSRRRRQIDARQRRIPRDRKCPGCGRLVMAARKWFVPPSGAVSCLSCHFKATRDKPPTPRRERRRRRRAASVPADRRCPTCGNHVPEVRRWFTGSSKRRADAAAELVECLACRRRRVAGKLVENEVTR